ncbi:MAG: presqualene diphosphate synthase HpnD [Pseudomonadota bacterium]
MTPQDYCEQKVRQSGSSFYYSFLFLSPKQRRAMIALYAFCREIDDIVDNSFVYNNEPGIAQSKLNWWRSEINNAYKNQASHPIAIAITHCLENYDFKQKYFLDLISGMEMDLSHKGFETWDELKNYCYYAAGTVGLLSIEITGYAKENQQNIQNYAKNLATTLQLINILRDVKEDFQRNRIYIPRQEMLKFGVTSKMFHDEQSNDKTLALFSNLAQQIESSYQQALIDLSDEDRYQQKSGLIMAKIYLAIFNKIKQQHYPVTQQRISIHPIHKLWIAWKTARQEARREKLRIAS